MTARRFAPSAENYSPQRRTALLLSGTGTAGAYHAGVLRALHEAGVKLDVVAGRGIGVVGALFAAVDGAQRLWDENGFWRTSVVTKFYPWRLMLQVIVWALAVSVAIVTLPLLAMVVGLVVFPIDFVAKMVGASAAGGLVQSYLALADAAFAPAALPTWLPRLVLLVLGLAVLIAIGTVWFEGNPRRHRGRFWWRIVGAPLATTEVISHCWSVLWDLLRGAAQLRQPAPVELARRYTEVLGDNIRQPGFRELLVAAHDIDARRDLVFALVTEARRRDLVRRSTSRETEARRSEVIDLSGVGRDHLVDAVAGALTIPLATDPHTITFAAESYWRGEAHRLCDRSAALLRLVEELEQMEVGQIILVSAAPDSAGPHTLSPRRVDVRGRLGEYLQSAEAATLRDITSRASSRPVGMGQEAPRIFTIRPAHNPIGPLDFGGGFDDRSDRRQSLAELMNRGYQDAYHQFIEPVVGASGEQISG